MKKFLLAFIIAGCATLGSVDDEDDPELYPVCKMICERKYHDVYGIQFRRVRKDLVFCKCLKPGGDRIIYTNIDHDEVEADIEVEVTQ